MMACPDLRFMGALQVSAVLECGLDPRTQQKNGQEKCPSVSKNKEFARKILNI